MLTDNYFIEACKHINAGYTPGGNKIHTYSSGITLALLLQKIGAIQENDVILDVGSGNGRLAMGLYKLGYRQYFGLEIIPQCVEFCKKTFAPEPGFKFIRLENSNHHYFQGKKSAEDVSYPIPDNSIDVAVALSFFSHTGTLQVARRHLDEIKRVCKPGSKVYSTWFFGDSNPAESKTVYKRSVVDDLFCEVGLTILSEGDLHGTADQNQITLLAKFQ